MHTSTPGAGVTGLIALCFSETIKEKQNDYLEMQSEKQC